jgi:hypothetical protein
MFVNIIIDKFQLSFFNTHSVNSSFIPANFIFSNQTLALTFTFLFSLFLSVLYSKIVILFLVFILSAKVFILTFLLFFILITSLVQIALIMKVIFLSKSSFIIHLNLSYHLSNTHTQTVHIIFITSSMLFILSLFFEINSSTFVEYRFKFNGVFLGFQFLSIFVATTLFKQYHNSKLHLLQSCILFKFSIFKAQLLFISHQSKLITVSELIIFLLCIKRLSFISVK